MAKLKNIQEILKKHKLSLIEYEQIKNILLREPNLLEIAIFSAMWSEHCSYKSSKKFLIDFPTTAPWVIQGPGENAGVIDIGDGYAAVFKMESHNHPSFIEPYEGAATGVGGIMRDIFTMGARPVASLNSLRFGNITNKDDISRFQRFLVRGVVGGISNYGNCMGVPTIGGEISFNESFNGNIVVNAFNLGIVKSDEIFYAKAEGAGNLVIYVGSKTGRDGLGGAVMSSDSFTKASKHLRPTVQVGDPFSEKLLLEACLELFKTDHIIGIQDMGAAGLTSSAFEMAGKSGFGMTLHLDKVPAREDGMTPYDFMLSESQERMLLCAKKGSKQAVIDIFKKWELDAAVIGEVTNSGNMELFWHNEKCAQIPIKKILDESPKLDRPQKKPKYLEELATVNLDNFKKISNQEAFTLLLSSMEVVDKAWVYDQYDSMVQTNSIKRGGMLDASVIRIKENKKALAMSADCNVRFCYINPHGGAEIAVMEAGRNVAMSGARPLAVTDCLNYGNPTNPEVMWQFAQGCLGIKQACTKLNTPVVAGNVSLYNETNGISIFPTPSIVTVGVNEDENRVLLSSFQKKGNDLYLIGDTKSEFGGSLYLKELYNVVAGTLPTIDYEKELALWDLVINANAKALLSSAKDLSSGGIAIAIAKMSITSGLGCDISVKVANNKDIFSESTSRAIIEIDPKNYDAFKEMLGNLSCQKIGTVCTNNIKINDINLNISSAKKIYFETFQKIVEQDI